MLTIRDSIFKMYEKFGLGTLSRCSDQEENSYSPLPNDIFHIDGFYYRYFPNDKSQEEHAEYLNLLKLKYIRTIKNILVFFTVIWTLGAIFGFIYSLIILL
jgi:hypothetical protein